jgi:HTH-type transcriptional regulator / antitoxin HigA
MLTTTKNPGKMTLTIDQNNFIGVLQSNQIVPKIIETEAEYENFLAVAEKLLAKMQTRSPEEDSLFKLLVRLIEDYEEQEFQMDEWCNTPSHEFLQFLMEAKGVKQTDLVGVVSSSKGVISAMVNGKRAISKAQAKKLAEIFKVPMGAFL